MSQPLFFEDRRGSHSDADSEPGSGPVAQASSLPDPVQAKNIKGDAAPGDSHLNTDKRKRRAARTRREKSRQQAPKDGTKPDVDTAAKPAATHPHQHENEPGSDSDCPSERENRYEEAQDAPIQVFGAARSHVPPPTSGRRKAVWVDDDDDDLPQVDLHTVKRRRKLRTAVGETHVSAVEYERRIRGMYEDGITPAPGGVAAAKGSWATLPSERKKEGSLVLDSEEEEEIPSTDVNTLLRTTTRLLKSRRRAAGAGIVDQVAAPLRPGVLNLRRVTNANQEDPNKAEARCVEFHPSGRLLLTAGLDKTLRIFQVDGVKNPKVQGLHLTNFPIHTAKFTGGGSQVIMAGRRRFFHQLDMETGRIMTMHSLSSHPERAWERFEASSDGSKLAFLGQQGKIVLLSNKSKREIGQLRLNSRVACVAFAAEGANDNHLYAASRDGTVYLWDIRRMDCIDRHKDEGAIHSTCLATSSAHYALGSDSGVVNVYSSSAMRASSDSLPVFGLRTEKPRKSFLNLTTAIDEATFNCDGKLLAFSSHDKKNAVKIVHIPTMTVYANWPTARANVRRACSLRFSPQGGYFAIGNDKGDVQLMRLPSYPAA